MILKNRIIVFLSIALLWNCGGTKQVTTLENAPLWVKEKPVNPEYYIGIGSAIKTQNPADYQASAKNNALADLSSDISINISSNSALYQMENSFGYSEDYQARTRTSTSKQLEGYNLVNSYENETHYYVYYRLSKSLYKELKQKKINEKSQIGLDYYTKAISSKEKNDYFNALILYLKGLESVKDYLSEPLEVQYNNSNILLGNELVSGLASTINEIIITPHQPEIKTKAGNDISNKKIGFTIANIQQTPLINMPIVFSIGKRPLRNNKGESDFKGNTFYSFQNIKQSNISFDFTAKLDFQAIAKQAMIDPIFRQMINKIEPPEAKTKIIVESASLYIESIEKNLGADLSVKPVENKVKQLLARSKYQLVENKEAADFYLEFDLNTSKLKQEGKMHYALLNGSIKLYNNENHVVFLKPVENIQGVQLNYDKAGLDAYEKFANTLETTFINRLKQSIK